MSEKYLGIIFLSGVLTFGASSAFAQTSPDKPKTAPPQKSETQKSAATQDNVKKAQQALKDKGVYNGAVDGTMNADFETALRTYQSDNQLQATGKLDQQTMAKLGVTHGKSESTAPSKETAPPKTNKKAPGEQYSREKPTPVPPMQNPDTPQDRFPDAQKQPPASSTPSSSPGTVSSVEDIRQVQMTLKNRGFDPGEINGMLSSETQDAIRKFQAANNLPVTGVLDDRTQAALGLAVKKPDAKPPLSDQSFNYYDPALSGPSAAASEYTEPQTKDKDKDQVKAEKKEEKSNADLEKRVTKSVDVLNALTGAEDKRIPNDMLQRAQGIVVIPDMIKGAFGIGGRYGKGVVSKRMENGSWSAPAFVTIGGGSFGAQLGISSTDLVLVFTDKDAFDALQKKMTLKLGADAAVAAGPIGRAGEAGVTHDLKSGIYAYSRSKGLFAGVSVDGAVIDMDKDANRDLYGANTEAPAIFSNTTMITRGNVRTFTDALNRVAPKKPSEK